jgi:hypothetical protein
MALDNDQLAGILQACIEKAGDLLVNDGGFLPFGARAAPGGEIEFMQFAPESEDEGLDTLQGRLAAALKAAVDAGDAVGCALVAHVAMPEGENAQYERAIAVQVEAPGFCRLVVAPYGLEGDIVELGPMLPDTAQPAVFAA